jgi:serine-type D-Ala-D-Ala carboxypeptidase/endopeptidase
MRVSGGTLTRRVSVCAAELASRWLPAGPNVGIILRQLATHTSGLPRLAPNMNVPTVDLANPYAEFRVEQAEDGLRQPVAAPGAPMLYSNFGYQLLGLVLERASGLPVRAADHRPVAHAAWLEPFWRRQQRRRHPAPGHDHRGELPHWGHPLAAAGGVEATIGDLASYTSACLRPPPSPLGAAIAAAQTPVEDGGHQGLAWRVSDDGIRWHTGSTGRETSDSRSISRSAAGGQTAESWPTPRSRSPTARSACGSASSRQARSQA